jgi:4-carboxymuconolactone decarboxylase
MPQRWSRRTAIGAIALALASRGAVRAAPTPGMTSRLTTPRVPPIPEAGRSDAQKQMLASRGDLNIYKTLAVDPELYARWSPLGQFILNGSSLPPRHREMLILRMGWLCQAPYEWAQHARIALGAPGLSKAEVHRIAEGPDAKGWSDFERTLLIAVAEIRYEAMISDATWKALRTQYSDHQVMEALFTAAQYQLVSMALNSLGVQLEPTATELMPKDVAPPRPATTPRSPRLKTPRIAPLAVSQMSEDQRKVVAAQIRPDGTVFNLYSTLANHPVLAGIRANFGTYLQRDSHLPAKTRELVILRTSRLIGCEYEWAHHVEYAKAAGLTDAQIARVAAGPSAAGWSEEHRAVLRAVDELRREAFISDATWAVLKGYYDVKQLVEIIFTSGGYAMTGAAINSFGIQLERGVKGWRA